MVYQWSGFKYPVSAQKIGEEIERIEAENGSVTKELVVDAARPEESVMHKIFEWRDDVAAEKWRCQQAKQMLSSLHVVVQESTEAQPKAITVRAYVNTELEDGRKKATYFSVVRAMQPNTETRDNVIANAMRELEEFNKKYRTISELKDIIAAIDRFLEIPA